MCFCGVLFLTEGAYLYRATPLRALSLESLVRPLEVSLELQYGLNSAPGFHLSLIHRRGRYMSTGLGRGNAYGLAAACGALFPFMMFGRLYWPGPPMTNILFFVTAVIVSCSVTAPEIWILTVSRSLVIPGTTRTLSLLRRSLIGASILLS